MNLASPIEIRLSEKNLQKKLITQIALRASFFETQLLQIGLYTTFIHIDRDIAGIPPYLRADK